MFKKFALTAIIALSPTLAMAEADGPDAWRVSGEMSVALTICDGVITYLS